MSGVSYKGIKTIVWDFDGTLINSFGVFCEVTSEVLKLHGRPVPIIEVMSQNFHGSLEDSVNNSAGGLEPDVLEAVMKDWLKVQNKHYEVAEQHLFADALELARRAKEAGIKQVIVTNRAHKGRLNGSPRSIVANSSLKDLIEQVIAGDDGPHRKPLIEVFDGAPPDGSTTLVVGDQYVDILFANNLGARAIIVNRGSETLAHLDKLHDSWQDHTEVVASLDTVTLG